MDASLSLTCLWWEWHFLLLKTRPWTRQMSNTAHEEAKKARQISPECRMDRNKPRSGRMALTRTRLLIRSPSTSSICVFLNGKSFSSHFFLPFRILVLAYNKLVRVSDERCLQAKLLNRNNTNNNNDRAERQQRRHRITSSSEQHKDVIRWNEK